MNKRVNVTNPRPAHEPEEREWVGHGRLEGATWLPFEPFATLKAGVNGDGSKEVVWTRGSGHGR
jgi:hypothetical protein